MVILKIRYFLGMGVFTSNLQKIAIIITQMPINKKVDKIIIDGNGTRFLANDGLYKAVSGGGGGRKHRLTVLTT